MSRSVAARKPARVLLVEGPEDREVVFHLCNHHQLDNRNLFDVVTRQGYEGVRDELEVRPLAGEVDVIGAIVDADESLEQRWRSLRQALVSCGYADIPESPQEQGTIIPSQGRLPRVGLWLMPNNHLAGMLEDFLQQLIRQGDILATHAQQSVQGLPERRFKPTYHSKAVLHTWLAWQEEPGTPLGLAVTRHYLDGDHSLAQRFLLWLQRLFTPAPAA